MSKSGKVKDPFANREAKKYDEPIPSREYILAHFEKVAVPVDYETLCDELGLVEESQCEALRRRLIAMSRDGQLISNRRGVYGLSNRMELIKGLVQGTKDDYGFFVPADGSEDLYLSSAEMQKVFDGDTVLARVSGQDKRGRKEGTIVEILQRRSSQIVGRYYSDGGFGILVSANRRISHEILVPEPQSHGARDGQFVVGEITSFPSPRHKPIARIVEILGDSATPGLEIDIAVRSHDLPHRWTEEVLQQAARIDDSISKQELSKRIDLRDLPFVTIDGEDAKDFDDAVYAEAVEAAGEIAWKLYVAIADVSHFVEVDTPLDREAVNRGSSVYFPGHVIPMLPEDISNGVCSLQPKRDRLVMVCEMDISKSGGVKHYRFFEGVIHSHARLTYTEVADILEPNESETGKKLQQRLQHQYAELVPHLQTLYAVFHKLRKTREDGGALDFDTIETRIVFGENRRIREIVPVVRNCAHRLIEECMLCANVAAAELLEPSGIPVLYRVHEGPSQEKLQNLRDYLRELGLALGGGDEPQPHHYQALLKQVAKRADAHLLHTMVIRSMMQAVYQAANVGHFGLGFEAYTHFTSPIRRYPDLLVHRAIRFLVRNKNNSHLLKRETAKPLPRAKIYPYSPTEMQTLGENCSMRERRADAASYDVVDWLKCEYMQGRLGEEFMGTVSSVTSFGIFVELEDIYIEGLVHITALDNDYYRFDPIRHELRGERSGKSYLMGDRVRIRVAAVNLDDRKIDLVLADSKGSSRTPKSKRSPGAENSRTAGPGAKAKRHSSGKSAAGGFTGEESATKGKADKKVIKEADKATTHKNKKGRKKKQRVDKKYGKVTATGAGGDGRASTKSSQGKKRIRTGKGL